MHKQKSLTKTSTIEETMELAIVELTEQLRYKRRRKRK